MFILNRKTNLIQECHNSDVINICKADEAHYAVAATKEELLGAKMPQNGAEADKVQENMGEAQKNDSEPSQEAQEPSQEAMNPPEGNNGEQEDASDWKNLDEEEKVAALEKKSVVELRKIAKAEGIQGYANMNKDTLVAMIMNH